MTFARNVLLAVLLVSCKAERDSGVLHDGGVRAEPLAHAVEPVAGFESIKAHLQDSLKSKSRSITQSAEEASHLAGAVAHEIDEYHTHLTKVSNTMKQMGATAKELHGHYGELLQGKDMAKMTAADASLIQKATDAAGDLQKAADSNTEQDLTDLANKYGKLDAVTDNFDAVNNDASDNDDMDALSRPNPADDADIPDPPPFPLDVASGQGGDSLAAPIDPDLDAPDFSPSEDDSFASNGF